MAEVGRDLLLVTQSNLLLKQDSLENVAQDHIQAAFEDGRGCGVSIVYLSLFSSLLLFYLHY